MNPRAVATSAEQRVPWLSAELLIRWFRRMRRTARSATKGFIVTLGCRGCLSIKLTTWLIQSLGLRHD
jgi:hypothetical protein